MNITDPAIENYCEAHTTEASKLLYSIERNTHLKVLSPHMLSHNHQGQFLTMITAMMGAKIILEIGTFTGYSAICFLAAIPENGMLHSIEVNPEFETMIQEHVEASGKSKQFTLHIGQALPIIEKMTETFDLVFIDAAKKEYIDYYNKILPKLRKGGIILADNILWKSKVLNESKDSKTQAMDDFNKMVQADDRVQNVLMPLRDGLMIIRKL